jgi:hypothetical protein
MGKKKTSKKSKPVDPGLGYSPYQREKGMAYTKSHADMKRDDRRQTKRDLKRGNWD